MPIIITPTKRKPVGDCYIVVCSPVQYTLTTMAMLQPDEQLTPREYEMMRYEKEERDEARAHAERMRQMDLKWQQVFTIPLALLMLPVRLAMCLALCIAYLRKYEPSESFWKLLS